MLTNSKHNGEIPSPHYHTKEYLKKFIADELEKNQHILDKLSERLDKGNWLITDEIELKVAQESIYLLNHIKSVCVNLGYYD